ncbi:MAG: hypothetical protein P4L33_03650 [Capsulimonadaceae bacterium]|nr:hypothetical protein [Capsulimonadaceae bacterium]
MFGSWDGPPFSPRPEVSQETARLWSKCDPSRATPAWLKPSLLRNGPLTMAEELEFLSRESAPPAYEIRDLGLLDDGRYCHALGINSHGVVVGEADTTAGVHAFVWRGGLIVDLGRGIRLSSKAIDINDDGMALGIAELDPFDGPAGVLWTGENLVDLSKLGIPGSGVRAINNQGQIVGEAALDDRRPPGAFLWTLGNITDLSGEYVDGGTAEAINNYGQVAGCITTLRQFDQAFFWSDGEFRDLGFGQARAINDHSVVAGITYQGNARPIACFWREFHRREIPLLPGFVSSEALAINDGGEIVGAMIGDDGSRIAFLWKREYAIDLNDVIDLALGWNLQEARAINNSGQIVGWGYLEHRHHGFLLTPNDRDSSRSAHLPPPREGAERVSVPDVVVEREESSIFIFR